MLTEKMTSENNRIQKVKSALEQLENGEITYYDFVNYVYSLIQIGVDYIPTTEQMGE